jgi:sulfur-oxidizing protein SoxY
MNIFSRRSFLQRITAGLVLPVILGRELLAAEWPSASFKARELAAALQSIVGDKTPQESEHIRIKAPEIAENGAVVPLTISTDLPDVKSIALFVSNNPSPLVSTFTFDGIIEPYVSTRVKMAKTSAIVALVETSSGYFTASRDIKVTIGGCGG